MNKFNFDLTVQDAEDLIQSGDWDGDGQLNFEEFCMIMMDKS